MTEELIVTHVFDATRDVVWKAFADPAALEKWWGPKNFEIKVHQLDFRPNGIFHYSMTGSGMEIWGKFIYGEIKKPGKIVFVNSFSDSSGNTARNPWIPTWPLEISNILTLEAEGDKTRLTLIGKPVNASDLEIAIFDSSKSSMQQGFKGTFDQLEEYLAAK